MNPILLQKQLKENANDLQDFCKDLKGWGEEMKRKENSLKNKEDNLKKTRIKLTNKEKDSKQSIRKTGLTDYAKWEKYDADLECENLEDDIKDDSELTDEFEESVRDEALVYKEKGNSYVKTKDWDKAIDCYTKAIKCYSYDPIFYANRALCHLKKGSFTAAEEDCTLSLKLDSTYVKALQRRAAARESLKKFDLAKDDLEKVLKHEPKNKESIAALEKIKQKIGPREEEDLDQQRPVSKFTASRSKIQSLKPIVSNTTVKTDISQKTVTDKPKKVTNDPSTSSWPDPGCDIIPVKAIDKPPHLRSKKPLKRIEIMEIENTYKIENKAADNERTNPVKQHVIENVKKVTFVENLNHIGEPVGITSAFKKKKDQDKNEKSDHISSEAWPKPNLPNDIIKSDDLKILEKNPLVKNTPKDLKNSENLFITNMEHKTVKDISIQKTHVAECVNQFSVPKSSVQFFVTWKNLKSPEDKYKYLKLINPNEISILFQESLESDVFSSIIEVLSNQFMENGDSVYEFLTSFTQVKRFSALTMFMDSTDKNRLWKLITYLRDQDQIPKDDVDTLVAKYEL